VSEFRKPEPQPEHPKYLVHSATEYRTGEKGQARTVTTGCGVTGPVPTMSLDPRAIRATGWGSDVTCPACRRRIGLAGRRRSG
jgi:hypothetical protein